MAELVHFVKRDPTARTTTSTTAAEVTQYTIAYEDLTGAGFVAGDDVIIIVQFNHGGNNASTYTRFQVGFGTTYAGRVDAADSYQSLEPNSTTSGHHYVWIDRRTLVDGEDIYFSLWASANTARAEGFRCIVLKKQDWMLYAEATHSGDAPTAYDTSGASISTDVQGDWLIIACSRLLDDSATADAFMAINDGSDRSEWRIEGEDTENERCIGTMAYRDNLAGSTTVRVRYRSDTASTHDFVRTALVAINLDKFKDHSGAHTTNTITHSVIDTYQDYATFTDMNHSQTGNVLALGLALHNVGEESKTPRGRILLDTAEWPAAGDNDAVPRENGTGARIGPFAVGYGSVSSGSRDWQFRVTDVSDVTPNYDCVEQIAVVFSLELAVAAATAKKTLLLTGVG